MEPVVFHTKIVLQASDPARDGRASLTEHFQKGDTLGIAGGKERGLCSLFALTKRLNPEKTIYQVYHLPWYCTLLRC